MKCLKLAGYHYLFLEHRKMLSLPWLHFNIKDILSIQKVVFEYLNGSINYFKRITCSLKEGFSHVDLDPGYTPCCVIIQPQDVHMLPLCKLALWLAKATYREPARCRNQQIRGRVYTAPAHAQFAAGFYNTVQCVTWLQINICEAPFEIVKLTKYSRWK